MLSHIFLLARRSFLRLRNSTMNQCDQGISDFDKEHTSTNNTAISNDVEYVQLHNQVWMPRIGFGTYRLKNEAVKDPVYAALETGYRHIDTASVYRNEQVIGNILGDLINGKARGSLKRREDIFITTKLAPKDQGFEKASQAIEDSIKKLGGTPIDLFLIHWPGCAGKQLDDPKIADMRLGSWRALEKAFADGKVRAIGVSNFQPRHLIHLLENARVVPHVNQVEFHPACQQKELMSLCKQHKIQLVAYASLGVGALLTHPIVQDVARGCSRTPAQVLLRWGLQKGVCVIPKASSIERIVENYDVFEFKLDLEAMEALDNISKEYSTPKHFCWDPEGVQF